MSREMLSFLMFRNIFITFIAYNHVSSFRGDSLQEKKNKLREKRE